LIGYAKPLHVTRNLESATMSHHPDDRPDPSEQPIRARVPDRVAGGCFSTGVIVMTAQTEFVLDFVQNLGRPHQIVARVVMPHSVLPQLVDALGRNIQLYKGRWGELPQPPLGLGTQIASGGKPSELPQTNQVGFQADPQVPSTNDSTGPAGPHSGSKATDPASATPSDMPLESSSDGTSQNPSHESHFGPLEPGAHGQGSQPPFGQQLPQNPPAASSHAATPLGINPSGIQPTGTSPVGSNPPGMGHGVRQATAQEIYDDLKIRDELLSGVYANAVMIGHGPHEFSFDFITNFYPHSAVSARVFMAAGQVPRLYDSLKGTWDQLRLRMQPPPQDPPPGWVV